MQSQLKIDIPSATTVRKIGATAVARSCSESEVRIVSRQMAHDPRVSANYYEAIKGAKDAKRAFDTMNKLVSKKESPSSSCPWDEKLLCEIFKKHRKWNDT